MALLLECFCPTGELWSRNNWQHPCTAFSNMLAVIRIFCVQEYLTEVEVQASGRSLADAHDAVEFLSQWEPSTDRRARDTEHLNLSTSLECRAYSQAAELVRIVLPHLRTPTK